MPRETVHCEVLDAVRLYASSELLTTYAPFAYVGALAPDAMYYYRLGRSEFESLGERMHGSNGEDTYDIPRAMAREILQQPQELRDPLWAFLMGYVSHCVVDRVFHPMIYFLTGNYYAVEAEARARARAEHRGFEVALDRWWHREYRAPYYPLARFVQDFGGSQREALFAVLQRACSLPEAEHQWAHAVWYMTELQRVFTSSCAAGLAKVVGAIAPSTRPHSALFSSFESRPFLALSKEISFKNPVTGKAETSSLHALREQAVAQCVEAHRHILAVRNTGAPLFPHEVGASLNSGLPRSTKESMTFYAE